MDATIILNQNIDKTQLPALHQKRVLAFVNHFIISSCSFLNDFALQCETKFLEMERKLQKVEAALTIIEAKLASIPDVEKYTHIEFDKLKEANKSLAKTEPNLEHLGDDVKGIKVSEHSLYAKFFKMQQVGVPKQAIKMKMQVEGVDPNMLDEPDLIISFEGNRISCQKS